MEAYTAPVLPFLCAVDDLSGCYELIKEGLEARLPLRRTQFRDSTGNVSELAELHLRYVPTADPYVQRLRQLSYSPVTWFRNPFVQLVIFSCEDAEEYRRVHRPQLKAIADPDARIPIAPELVIAYISPPGSDPRLTAKVIDSVRRDFAHKRRERCVKLDPSSTPGAASRGMPGMSMLEGLIQEAITLTFEARVTAYLDACRQLMGLRLEPGWSFCNLFLVKDAYAFMLESAGLIEDARREYAELEVCLTEQQSSSPAQRFAAFDEDADEDAPMWHSWVDIRKTVLSRPVVPSLVLRQLLFASQARLLTKAQNWAELAELGAAFVRSMREDMCQAGCPSLRAASWAFAAYTNLAELVSRASASRGGFSGALPSLADRMSPAPSAGHVLAPREDGAAAASPIAAQHSAESRSIAGRASRPEAASPALQEALEWELGPLAEQAVLGRGAEGARGPRSPRAVPRPAAGTAAAGALSAERARVALFASLGHLFASARAELEACEAAESGGPLLAARKGAAEEPAQAPGKPPAARTPRAAEGGAPGRVPAGRGAGASDSEGGSAVLDEDGMQSVALDASSTQSASVDEGPRPADSESGAGPRPTAPLPGPAARPPQHRRHVSVSSIESSSVTGDDLSAPRGPHTAPVPPLPRGPPPGPLASAPVAAGAAAGVTPRTQSAPAVPAPVVDYMDPRFVEQQVLSPAGPLPLPRLLPAGARRSDDGAGPPRHWRVRRALASRTAFRGLWIGLSLSAGAAYASAGHWRSAALLRGEAAGVLAGALDAGEGDPLGSPLRLRAEASDAAASGPADAVAAAAVLAPVCEAVVPAGWPGVSGPLLVSLLRTLSQLEDEARHGRPPHGVAGAARCAVEASAALLRALRRPGAALEWLADGRRVADALLRALRAGEPGDAMPTLDGAFALEARLALDAPRFHGRLRPGWAAKDALGPRACDAALLEARDGGRVVAVGDPATVALRVERRWPGSGSLVLRDLVLVADVVQLGTAERRDEAEAQLSGPAALSARSRAASPTEEGAALQRLAVLPAERDGAALYVPGPQSKTWTSAEAVRGACLQADDRGVVVLSEAQTTLEFVARPLRTGLLVPRWLEGRLVAGDGDSAAGAHDALPLVVPIATGSGAFSHPSTEQTNTKSRANTLPGGGAGDLIKSQRPHPSAQQVPDTAAVAVAATVRPPRPHVAARLVGCEGGSVFAGETRWLGIQLTMAGHELARDIRLRVQWPNSAGDEGPRAGLPEPLGRERSQTKVSHGSLPGDLGAAGGASHVRRASTALADSRSGPSFDEADPGLLLDSPTVRPAPSEPWLFEAPGQTFVEADAQNDANGAAGGEPSTLSVTTSAVGSAADRLVCVPRQAWARRAPSGSPPPLPLASASQEQLGTTTLWCPVEAVPWLPAPVAVRIQPGVEATALRALPQLEINRESAGAALPLEVALEWREGARTAVSDRSALLALPLRVLPPLAVHLRAQEIAGGELRVLLGATVTSLLPAPLTIESLTLGPQLGMEVVEGPAEGPGLALAGGASLDLTWLLRPEGGEGALDRARLATKLRQSARFGSGVLSVEYRARAAPGPAGLRDLQPAPESAPSVFRHTHVLELAEQAEPARETESMLLLRFLGPFEAPAGEKSVFCWRLERPQGAWAAAEEGSQELRYEVSAAHGSWDPAGVRKGRVLLGRAPGSVATVEAAFAPRALGRLACPRLVLHGVHSQEPYDPTQDVGIIRVVPSLQPVNLTDVPL